MFTLKIMFVYLENESSIVLLLQPLSCLRVGIVLILPQYGFFLSVIFF